MCLICILHEFSWQRFHSPLIILRCQRATLSSTELGMKSQLLEPTEAHTIVKLWNIHHGKKSYKHWEENMEITFSNKSEINEMHTRWEDFVEDLYFPSFSSRSKLFPVNKLPELLDILYVKFHMNSQMTILHVQKVEIVIRKVTKFSRMEKNLHLSKSTICEFKAQLNAWVTPTSPEVTELNESPTSKKFSIPSRFQVMKTKLFFVVVILHFFMPLLETWDQIHKRDKRWNESNWKRW